MLMDEGLDTLAKGLQLTVNAPASIDDVTIQYLVTFELYLQVDKIMFREDAHRFVWHVILLFTYICDARKSQCRRCLHENKCYSSASVQV